VSKSLQTAKVALKSKLPNKACSGFLGVCAIYKHFSGFGFFYISNLFSAAQNPLTQTVGRLNEYEVFEKEWS